jgi:DNA primase
VLGEHDVEACAKTSGAKGVHVYVPLRRTQEYGAVAFAARRVADLAEQKEPDFVTTEFMKANRGGKVFLDFTRLGPGKHMAAPYSVRARPGATVSFPVPWNDLERVQPGDFTIRTVPTMLDGRDPWRDICPEPQTLPEALVEPPASH